ncbi:hypothetical protein K438DRAFT_2016004 [Mycena galopus ATCC 62051]|nr:hypothetical protein K438DRAFT_2016004 [Mycena galopus ATCC 62051]
MKHSSPTTVATSIFLASIPFAAAQNASTTTSSSGGLTSQQCILNCSEAVVDASGCDINLTQCATSTCTITASNFSSFLSSECPKSSSSAGASPSTGAGGPSSSSTGSSSSSPSSASPTSTDSGSASPTGTSVPNTAQFSVNRIGVAAASSVGLVFYELLV